MSPTRSPRPAGRGPSRRNGAPTRRRALTAAALSTCALALVASPANAATVYSDSYSASFTDLIGEINTVSVTKNPLGSIVFTDTSAPIIDADGSGGCEVSGSSATCPASSFGFGSLSAGAGADSVTLNDSPTSYFSVDGGAGDDTLTGSSQSDTMSGGAGADTIVGNGGNDSLNGGSYYDLSDGGDVVSGGEGIDYVSGGGGADTLSGGDGNDTVSGGDARDVINGDAGDDQLYGDGDYDVVNGDAGDDQLSGGQGADNVNGGAGDDFLAQVSPYPFGPTPLDSDTFSGDAGVDIVSYDDRTDPVTVTADDNIANDGVAGENDNIRDSVEIIVGGSGADRLTGNGQANELYGFNGADVLSGLGGGDSLFAGFGNDTLTGGAGHDELRGESGEDVLRSADGGSDQVGCGSGDDSVDNDAVDTVDGDCERVAVAPVAGPRGPAGPAGPAGPPALPVTISVTCKRTGDHKRQVTCTTRTQTAKAGTRVSLRLSRNGMLIASAEGPLRNGTRTMKLKRTRAARAGNHLLTTRITQANGTKQTIKVPIVLR